MNTLKTPQQKANERYKQESVSTMTGVIIFFAVIILMMLADNL